MSDGDVTPTAFAMTLLGNPAPIGLRDGGVTSRSGTHCGGMTPGRRTRDGRAMFDRLAFGTLLILAVSFGLGDIARVTSVAATVLTAVRALLPLAIALALLATLLRCRVPSFPSRLAAPALAWLTVLIASATLAPSNRLDALASLERPASGALLAWAVWDVCRTRVRWRLLAQTAALGGLAIALVGLAEASGTPAVLDWLAGVHDGAVPIGDLPRIASTLSHPNEAAMLLELTLPLLVAWTLTASRAWRVPLAVAAVCNLVAMVLTFSRAGLMAGTAGLTVMAGLHVARGQRGGLMWLGGAALAVSTAVFLATLGNQGLTRRLTAELVHPAPASTQPASVQADPGVIGAELAKPDEPVLVRPPARTQFWSAALEMLRDHPVLGVGPDNFRWRFAGYAGVPVDNLGVHAHDQYLEALADTGLLGLLGLGWMLATLVGVAFDRARPWAPPSADWPWRAAILASLSAWLLHALLDDFERFWPASVAFWLLAGLNLAVEEPPSGRHDGDNHQQNDNAHR